MKTHRTSKVFVPGGMPKLTYVARNSVKLEETLKYSIENLHKLITVTGQTKSGKTVLVSKVLPRDDGMNIWIDGGSVKNEDDLWSTVLQETQVEQEFSNTITSVTTNHAKGDLSGKVGIPALAQMSGKGEIGTSRSGSTSETRSIKATPRAAAIKALRAFEGALVIDDFHYLQRDIQGSLIRALKPLIFDGLQVVVIAIPHRRFDAVRVEREMTGRIWNIDVPVWEESELREIADVGFPLLNVIIADEIPDEFAKQAYGSPHLMQEFCQRLATKSGITETVRQQITINNLNQDIFCEAAEGTGKVIYDKLARGPRQRTDRLQRALISGGTTDIYGVVLKALSSLAPGLDTIEYEQIRSAIRSILSDALPQAHEVTRVLERMAEIASSDESSTPVIDWDKDESKLHITDPFFAFYLKWGAIA